MQQNSLLRSTARQPLRRLACIQAFGIDPSQNAAYWHFVAQLGGDVVQAARGWRLNLHRGFVGFDVEQSRTALDHIPFRHVPNGQRAMGHIHINLWQDHFGGCNPFGTVDTDTVSIASPSA